MEHFSPPIENFLYLRKRKPQKNLLKFSRKKVFLTFRETETIKKLLTFQETELSYISLIFQEVSFEARKMIRKNFLYFRKRNFSFFTFFRCFIFHSAGIYVFHLCWVFSFFTFLTCFLCHISRVFSFFQLVRVFLYGECYRCERALCTLRRLLLYTLFPTFDTTCFYQGFPGS